MIYSLVETTKENGLDPNRYLLWILQNAPQLSEMDEARTEKLFPANREFWFWTAMRLPPKKLWRQRHL